MHIVVGPPSVKALLRNRSPSETLNVPHPAQSRVLLRSRMLPESARETSKAKGRKGEESESDAPPPPKPSYPTTSGSTHSPTSPYTARPSSPPPSH